MSIQYIAGLSGSGKTQLCLEQIQMEINKKNSRPLIYIVPEQFTLEAEKMLVRMTKGSGKLNAEVLSFSRLAYRVFSVCGFTSKKVIGDIGKIMALQKVFSDLEKDLVYFKNTRQKGFLEELKNLIGELYRYQVQPDFGMLESLQDNLLKQKLADLFHIFQAYHGFISQDYISAEDRLDLLAQVLQDSSPVQNAMVWIDNFFGFTPQEYKVIEALSSTAHKITITLTLPCQFLKNKQVFEYDYFYETKRTLCKLDQLWQQKGVHVNGPVLLRKNVRHQQSEALGYMEKHFFSFRKSAYQQPSDNLMIFEAADPAQELESVACKIIELVRDKRLRYRDIALLLCDEAAYRQSMKNVMGQYGIPVFFDERKLIYHHPLTEFFRALLDIVRSNRSYESMFRYLKTGLTSLSMAETDMLENYVLAYGIKGNSWDKPWPWGYEQGYFEMEIMESLRLKAMESIYPFSERIKRGGKYNVATLCTELFNHAEQLNIPEKLALRDQLLKGTEGFDENESRKVWRSIMDIFDKINDTFGQEPYGVKPFIQIFEAGLSQCDIGSIPSGVDQVIVGDLKRTRLHQIQALFIVGITENVLPEPKQDAGILSEKDRAALQGAGIEMAPYGIRKACEEQFLIYMALTKPSSFLHLSYPLSDHEGQPQRPSVVVGRIKKMFPRIKTKHGGDMAAIDDIAAARPVYSKLLTQISSLSEGDHMPAVWRNVYAYFLKRSPQALEAELKKSMLYRDFAKLRPAALSRDTIQELGRRNVYTSVSRIEQYISCPFSYFLQYDLQAKERKLYQLNTPDLGILFHSMLDDFSNKLEQAGTSWLDLEESQMGLLVEQSIDELAPKMEVLSSSYKNKYLVNRLKRIGKRAVWALREQTRRGDFYPEKFEQGFGPGEALAPVVLELSQGQKIILNGRIDRIDVLEQDGKRYVKIIDYKSGKKDFNLQDLYYGIQLQLLVYLDAALKSGLYDVPAGMFYFKIKDPMITVQRFLEDAEIEGLLLKEMKLSGLLLEDSDLAAAMDRKAKGYSDIIPARFKNDGTLGVQSSAATPEQFDALRKHGEKIIIKAADEMLSGYVPVYPIKNGALTACDYCRYKSVCSFDLEIPNCQYHVLKPLKKEELWQSIMEGWNPDDGEAEGTPKKRI